MADKSTAHRDDVLNTMRGTTLTAFAPYVSLHTGDPGATGANEVTGDTYARPVATFGAPAAGAVGWRIANSAAVEGVAVDSAANKTVTWAGIWDSATPGAGTFRYRIPLATPRVVNAGLPWRFEIGDLTVEEE